jgi:hypothetical protein
MANNSADIVETIRINYSQLDDNRDAIFAACATDAQRAQFRALFAAAREAYFDALDKAFDVNNPTVQTLTQQLDTTNKDIQGQVTALKDVVAFLNTVAAAVKLATTLAKLAAAA